MLWSAALCLPNICVFCKVSKPNNELFATVLSILPLCQSSVSLVSTQITQPCCESITATDTFIFSVVCCWGVDLGQVFPNLSGHVPLQHFVIWTCIPKISYDKKAEENNKNVFTNIGIYWFWKFSPMSTYVQIRVFQNK